MPQFRFRGRFVSAAKASQLSHLKGASKYLSQTLTASERQSAARAERQRQSERRSEAARRGWELRRERERAETQRRSEAARLGWQRRRERERAETQRRSEAARLGWQRRREREEKEKSKAAFPYLPKRVTREIVPEPAPVYDSEVLRERLTDLARRAEDIEGVIPERITRHFAEDVEEIEEAISRFEDTGDAGAYDSAQTDMDRLEREIDEAEELEFDWDYDEVSDEFLYDVMLDSESEELLDIDEEGYEEAA